MVTPAGGDANTFMLSDAWCGTGVAQVRKVEHAFEQQKCARRKASVAIRCAARRRLPARVEVAQVIVMAGLKRR